MRNTEKLPPFLIVISRPFRTRFYTEQTKAPKARGHRQKSRGTVAGVDDPGFFPHTLCFHPSPRWMFRVPCSLFIVSDFGPRPIPISRLFIQPATPEAWLASPKTWSSCHLRKGAE